MPTTKVTLDHAAIAAWLRSDGSIRSLVDGAADDVAAEAAASTSEPVDVDRYTTDRAAAAVTIKSPKGMGVQAVQGVLSRAAHAAGLEFKAR